MVSDTAPVNALVPVLSVIALPPALKLDVPPVMIAPAPCVMVPPAVTASAPAPSVVVPRVTLDVAVSVRMPLPDSVMALPVVLIVLPDSRVRLVLTGLTTALSSRVSAPAVAEPTVKLV